MPDQPAMKSAGTRLALFGGLLVAITAAGWAWFAFRPYDRGLDVGTLPFAAATVAWVSGAPTWQRAVVRTALAIVALALFWTGLALELFDGDPPRTGFAQIRWWEVALPPVALLLGWFARRPGAAQTGRAAGALLVVPALAYAAWRLSYGHWVKGGTAAFAAVWLAAVLASGRRSPSAHRSGWATRVATSLVILVAGAYLLLQVSSLGPARNAREYVFTSYEEGDAEVAFERFVWRLGSGWFVLVPVEPT